MTKYRTLAPGDGITGPTGLEYRNLTNDMIPGDAYFIPEDFVWTGDLSYVANRTLIISYEHNVSGNITLPAGCTLRFDGGSLLGGFTLIGNSSRITNVRNEKIFDLTVTFLEHGQGMLYLLNGLATKQIMFQHTFIQQK
jgi:hypothetical protein